MHKKYIILGLILALIALLVHASSIWTGTTVGERIWYNSGYPYANNSYRVDDFIVVS